MRGVLAARRSACRSGARQVAERSSLDPVVDLEVIGHKAAVGQVGDEVAEAVDRNLVQVGRKVEVEVVAVDPADPRLRPTGLGTDEPHRLGRMFGRPAARLDHPSQQPLDDVRPLAQQLAADRQRPRRAAADAHEGIGVEAQVGHHHGAQLFGELGAGHARDETASASPRARA